MKRFVSELQPLLSSRVMLVTLGLLLAVDLLFMLLHAAHILSEYLQVESAFRDPRFSIEEESGYAEHYEYAKTAMAILAMIGCWVRTRQPIHAALSAVLCLLLLDNALMLHEGWGWRISTSFRQADSAFEHGSQALGEFAYSTVVGGAALGLVGLALWRTAPPHRTAGVAFILLLLALGGFGVGLDLVHTAVAGWRRMADRAFGFAEDSGELVILSIMCVLSCALYARLSAQSHRHRLAGPADLPPPVPGAEPSRAASRRAAPLP